MPRLRSRPAVSPQPGASASPDASAAVRLMVFSLERQSVFEALTVVRPLLSVQGSVELDPGRNTISVRDNLAAPEPRRHRDPVLRSREPAGPHRRLADPRRDREDPPVRTDTGISPDLLARLQQLLRFNTFSLLAHSRIASREGEAVVYEMAQGYRLNFELGSVAEGKRIRLAGFRMVRALAGAARARARPLRRPTCARPAADPGPDPGRGRRSRTDARAALRERIGSAGRHGRAIGDGFLCHLGHARGARGARDPRCRATSRCCAPSSSGRGCGSSPSNAASVWLRRRSSGTASAGSARFPTRR